MTLVDERLYLPESWCDDPQRCEQAGSPEAHRSFKTKVALALEMVAHQRGIGVRFAWVGADGSYGNDPAYLRGMAAMGTDWARPGYGGGRGIALFTTSDRMRPDA